MKFSKTLSILKTPIFYVYIVMFILLGFCGYGIHKSITQPDTLNNLLTVKQVIRHNFSNIKNLSYKQYKQKLKHHQLVAYQKVFNLNKNQYYAVFYGKNNHTEYTVPMINYHNKNHFMGYKKIKYYNKLTQPPKKNKPGFFTNSIKTNRKNYKNWFCGNRKAIQHFLGSETFNHLKVKQNKICHNS